MKKIKKILYNSLVRIKDNVIDYLIAGGSTDIPTVREPGNHWTKCKLCGEPYEIIYNPYNNDVYTDEGICPKCLKKEKDGKEKQSTKCSTKKVVNNKQRRKSLS